MREVMEGRKEAGGRETRGSAKGMTLEPSIKVRKQRNVGGLHSCCSLIVKGKGVEG